MSVTRFGSLEGTDILEIRLANAAGAEARILTWGAVVRDLVVPGPAGPQRVVLGLDSIEDYVAHSPYFGAIVGRYGNRVADAAFRLGAETFTLVPNEGRNQLHGGPAGFSRRIWSILAHDESSVTLALVSEDGDMGYPGRLTATCTYRLLEPATLRIELLAVSDRPTPVNLTTHSYYNLDGGDIRDHRLRIEADHITPTRPDLIPTGEIRLVDGTPYDFREARPVRGPEADFAYDINYVLRRERSAEAGVLARAAHLASTKSGLGVEIWTTEPGLQFYNGHLLDVAVPGLDGRPYPAFTGLALEPQRFPDGPNRSFFPDCILRPGEVSRQVNELRFAYL